MSAPTLINLPPHPSNPETPSDMGPGTPNSGTTSLSALSTTAIKDGHQGHAPPHVHNHQHSTSSSSSANTLDAERADRISRLAGLERVATARGTNASNTLTPGSAAAQPPGYFESTNPQMKERSTVGSASATGSVGGRTTWADGSESNDVDKMSEDPDDGVSSTGGFSDEGNASLVGFGEGASSTVSGPVSNTTTTSTSTTANRLPARPSGLGSPTIAKGSAFPAYMHQPVGGMAAAPSPASPNTTSTVTTASAAEQQRDAKMIDGMTYDPNVIDTVTRSPRPVQGRTSVTGTETAERIMGSRLNDGGDVGARAMGSPDMQRETGPNVGKFYFEEK
ncbi:MAG: hypothetical protein M1833_004195 [Piccolia ochrophora]|nr:MAG: hypothetical protein M1833_004195 [Piccolia ochrophora]